MRVFKMIWAYLIILTGTFWVIGFIVFSIIAISMKYHSLEQANAIIVFTGGNDRIKEAIQLLQTEKADHLFISGVDESVTGYHFLKEVSPDIQQKIELGYWAKTTRMNAIETAEWVEQNKISSVILVTSFYHMPRSLLEIKRAIPGLQITPYPVFPKSFGTSTDWIHTRYAWQLFVEYHKFLIVKLKYFLERI